MKGEDLSVVPLTLLVTNHCHHVHIEWPLLYVIECGLIPHVLYRVVCGGHYAEQDALASNVQYIVYSTVCAVLCVCVNVQYSVFCTQRYMGYSLC